MARKPHGGILRSLRTFAFFSARRAIDMKVLTDLRIPRCPSCGCLKQDGQDEQDEQDTGTIAGQGRRCRKTCIALG